ncbi:MAG: DUF354 domain-containing protein [Nitrososphaerota archaeon]|nr:DUF354 domain-containing protein [Nitrososphaerales archaeon]MDW8045395.1 DUF354 domain-containing protein [Nitrososphaerota archaeon]
MKIWIDILTPKQALFFQPLVEELERICYDVFVTSRHYREVELLIRRIGMRATFIGEHGGGDLYQKLITSSERIIRLAKVVNEECPNCAISFSSPECARTSYGLGIKHICISDSPHAESVSKLTIPLSYYLLTPWIIPVSEWVKYGISKERVIKYRALDPVVWIRRRKYAATLELNLDRSKKTITVRLPEIKASYLLNIDKDIYMKLLDRIISHFPDCNIVALCRYSDQIEELDAHYGSKLIIPKDGFDGVSILSHTDVFVGMGGTMNAESALLGIPTISAYPGITHYVEKYLIKNRLVIKPQSIEGVVQNLERLLKDEEYRLNLKRRAERILKRMEDPISKIVSIIESIKGKLNQ